MRIEILDLAKTDPLEGFHFYEQKELGLGDYFLTNIFSDSVSEFRFLRATGKAGWAFVAGGVEQNSRDSPDPFPDENIFTLSL